MPRALTIAGSDSGGGAGIQADLKTFAAFGVYGTSAVTALTAQNTVGVLGVHEVPPEFVSLQIRAVVEDIGVDAVKTGMLSSPAVVSAVAREARDLFLPNLVVDPVMVAKSGDPLLSEDARRALVSELLPLAVVATPNVHEAAALAGFAVDSPAAMERAARAIHAMGPRYVVVKGGHLADNPRDLLFDGKEFFAFPGKRVDTKNTHGTGCTFASAIAACLARGMDVRKAVPTAKAYVFRAIVNSLALGRGHGPTNHFADLYKAGKKAGTFPPR
ncbi:MAG: bifunctional hydroxymethylpyrimidine kinase/phosphomethylpyrimidine kinase [Deltaproteobacteria bacterium]|nr:bifunctional hydroxymethylpyrimidine kinase/phosphomethylpyrimidine kinase [Deltaproteobacteria bacterium]